MTIWFVGRHQAALEWAKTHGLAGARFVDHLDAGAVAAGDVVVGTLPVHLAAEICGKGARFVFLAMDIPAAERGKELSAADMEKFGARLVEYRVSAVGEYQPTRVRGGR
jgi:CRISPR-associated protein Csx16